MEPNVVLTRKEFEVIYEFTNKVLSILNGIRYKNHLLDFNNHLGNIAARWYTIVVQQFENRNYAHICTLMADLSYTKSTDEYYDQNIDQLPCYMNAEQLGALKRASYRIAELSEEIVDALDADKNAYEERLKVIMNLFSDLARQYHVVTPSDILDKRVTENAVWMNIYNTAAYINDNYEQFLTDTRSVSNYLGLA